MGSPKLGKLSIETGGEQRFVDGDFVVLKGISAEQIHKSISKKDDPYHDYFIFSPKSDQSSVFVIKTDANAFKADETMHQFKLFASNEIGTLTEITDVKYKHMVDNDWDYPVKVVEVEIEGAKDRELTEAEKGLVASFSERVKERIKHKVNKTNENLTEQLIKEAIAEIEVDMMEVSWGHNSTSLETGVIDWEDEKGKKAVRVKFTVATAPDSISFKGFPKGVRERAIAFLDAKMREVFEHHPLISSRRIADIDSKLDYELVREEGEDGVVWRYPPNMPGWDNSLTDSLREFTELKKRDRVPEPKPNTPMPIPLNVYREFIDEFLKNKTFADQPGIYELNPEWFFSERKVGIAVVKSDRPQCYLTDETVRRVKEETGVDLSEEKAKLDEGTTDWSYKRTKEFLEGMSAKFKAVGQDLLLGDENFPLMKFDVSKASASGAGRVEIQPHTKPLLRPDQIVFEGDVEISDIGAKALREIIGDKPLGQSELEEKLLKIEELYHKEGYRIVGENLMFTDGRQIGMIYDDRGDRVRVIIQVVRLGKIAVFGDIPEKSRSALQAALSSKEGSPLRTGYLKSLRRAMENHELVLAERAENPICVQRPDGAFDINLAVERKDSQLFMSVGGGSMFVGGNVGAAVRHLIPGFSETRIDGSLGYYFMDGFEDRETYENLYGGVGVQFKSVPVNDRGVYLVNGLSFFRSPYDYWSSPDEVDEVGDSETESASVEVHIPLGSEGIASPFELWLGLNGDIVHREGLKVPTDKEVDRVDGYVGEDVGLQAFFIDLMKEGDALINGVDVGFKENVVDGSSDVTFGGSIKYNVPLNKYFLVKAILAAKKRLPFYDGDLLPQRMFRGIPYIDFGQGFGERYVADYYWHSGLFVYLTANEIVQPGVGATVSSDSRKKAHGGAGVVLSVAPIGLRIYIGVNQDGKLSFGLK
jgi:hypothetical protein